MSSSLLLYKEEKNLDVYYLAQKANFKEDRVPEYDLSSILGYIFLPAIRDIVNRRRRKIRSQDTILEIHHFDLRSCPPANIHLQPHPSSLSLSLIPVTRHLTSIHASHLASNLLTQVIPAEQRQHRTTHKPHTPPRSSHPLPPTHSHHLRPPPLQVPFRAEGKDKAETAYRQPHTSTTESKRNESELTFLVSCEGMCLLPSLLEASLVIAHLARSGRRVQAGRQA